MSEEALRASASEVPGERGRPAEWRRMLRRMGRGVLRSRGGCFGVIMVMAMVFAAALAPHLAPHSPLTQNLLARTAPPAWMAGGSMRYLLGTDQLGRDIASRIIYGARVSLLVGVTAVSISAVLGVLIGLVAGYYKGGIDNFFMRIADIQLSFPLILLAISIIAVLGPTLRNIILYMGIAGWVLYARIVRAEVLSLREREFVQAVRAAGGSDLRILFRHILPNLLTPCIVISTLQVARVIIMESSLTFLGLGIPPPTPTWGGMLSDGRGYLYSAWWIATLPGLAILLTVLGINLLGDRLRDVLDPRLDV